MECFAVNSKDIEGRIDPYFYSFYELEFPSQIKIREIAKLQGGFAFKSNEYLKDCGIPLVRIQNIKNSEIDLSDTVYINNKYLQNLSRFLLKNKDILIAMTGATIGKVGRIYEEDLPAFLNQRVGRFIIKHKKIHPDYLFYILQFTFFAKQINRNSLGGAQPNISPMKIEEIQIPLPPNEIQEKIVQIMDNAYKIKKQKETEAQQLLDSFEELLSDEKVLDLKKITQKKMFSINLNDLDGAFNPERYANQIQFDRVVDWIKINNIGQICRDTFTPEKTNPENIYSLMRIDDLANNPISAVTRNVKGKDVNGTILKVQTNDVLIARLGPTIENRKFILAPKSNVELISSNEFICLRCNEINNHYFALHLLKTDFYKNLMIQKTRGATPSRMRLSHEDFSELPFPTIDLSTQNKIAEEVKRRMQKAERLQKEAKQLLEEEKEKVEKIILNN